MAACPINLTSLLPDCAALKSNAGVRDFGYYCRRVDITGVTRLSDGTVTGVTIATGKLKKFQTQKFQNGAEQSLATSDIRKTRFKQGYKLRVYARSQADRNGIESVLLAPDVVFFSPNNDNQIEIYGLTIGLEASAFAWNTGTKLGDDNTALVTLEGSEPNLAPLFTTVAPATAPAVNDEAADFLVNVAYLDAKVGA